MINNQLFFFTKNLKLFGLEDKFDFVIRKLETITKTKKTKRK